MPTDLTVILEDRPGTLAALGEAAAGAGVNIDGIAGFPAGGEGIIHVLVEDAGAARSALEGAGIEVRDEREVLVVEAADRPGELARVAGTLGEAGVNIDLIYLTASGTRLVLGVDDLEAARQAVS